MAWLGTWANREKIRLNGSLIPANLTNFPVALNINATSGRTDKDLSGIFTELGTNKLKLAVTLEDGITECYVEVTNWQNASNYANLFVKVPSLTAGQDKILYLYYDSTQPDNSVNVGAPNSSPGRLVWDSDFELVYHFDETTASGQLTNSVENLNHGTPNNFAAGSEDNDADGASWHFDGTNDWVEIGDPFYSDDITIEVLFKPDASITSTKALVHKRNLAGTVNSAGNTALEYYLYCPATNELKVQCYDSSAIKTIDTASGDNEVRVAALNYGGFVSTGNGGNAKIFWNGQANAGTTPPSALNNTGSSLQIGSRSADNDTRYWDGRVYEVRISSAARSDDWLEYTYLNFFDLAVTWQEDVAEGEIRGAWLDDWAKRMSFTVDGDELSAGVTDFPVAFHIDTSSGKNNKDASPFFDELDYIDPTGDDFTGTNGDDPNSDLWRVGQNDGDNMSIQSNKLNFTSPGGAVNEISQAWSNFNLDGGQDYDLRIDFDYSTLTTSSGSYSWAANVSIRSADGTIIGQLAIGKSTGTVRYMAQGVNQSFTTYTTTDTSGKFRFSKVGSTVKGFVWSGTQWEWNGNAAGITLTSSTSDDVEFRIWFEQETNATVVSNVDNFTINTGTIVWPPARQPNRKKIAITDQDGLTQLPVEIDWFSQTSEKAVLHAKVPSLSAGENRKLYLYYDSSKADNDSFVGDPGDAIAQSVWDDDFKVVMHMTQIPTGATDDIKDSTSNENHGTSDGNFAFDDLGIGGGSGAKINFNGSDRIITISHDASINFGDEDHTIDVFYQRSNNSGTEIFFGKGYGGAGVAWTMGGLNSAGNLQFWVDDGTSVPNVPTVGTYDDGYNVVSFTRDTTANQLAAIVNGFDDEDATASDTAGDHSNTDDLIIGCRGDENASYYYDGSLCEFRMSRTLRSDAWIKATSKTLQDDFLTIGSEETYSGLAEFNWLLDDSNSPWAFRIPIVNDHTRVGSNLTNFPLAVQLSDSMGIDGVDGSHFFDIMDYPESVSDNFTGDNGDSISPKNWTTLVGESSLLINSNKARGSVDATTTVRRNKSHFKVSEDFEIEVDFDIPTGPSTDKWYVNLQVWDATGTNRVYAGMRYDGGREYYHTDVPGWTTTTVSSVATSGKIRLVRSGTNISSFYWTGSAWALIKSTTVAGYSNDMYVYLGVSVSNGNPTVVADFDNFVINYGDIVWDVYSPLSGKKVAFTLDDGITQLNAELEYIDVSSKEAIYHVKIPSLSSVTDTLIYMYYDSEVSDNDTYIGDVWNENINVWDANFIRVLHFAARGTDRFYDSAQDLSLPDYSDNVDVNDYISGPVAGKAVSLDGVDEYFELGGLVQSDLGTDCTFEVVSRVNTAGEYMLIENGITSGPGADFFSYALYKTDVTPTFYCRNSSGSDVYATIANAATEDVWDYVSGSNDGSTIDITHNASRATDNSSGHVPNAQSIPFKVGRQPGTTDNYYEADYKEVRVSNTARSADWRFATYHTLFDNMSYYGTYEAWLKDYSRRIKVVIDSSKIDSDLTNFPVLIPLISTNASELFTELATGAGPYANNAHPNRKKIRVATVGGEYLSTELDQDDIENDRLFIHSKVPSISSSEDTVLFVYFDNSADDANEVGDIGSYAGELVWDSDFEAVYHFSEPGSTLTDSTDNDNDGTISGGPSYDSPIGEALWFDGSNDYARTTGTALRDLLASKSTGYTIEAYSLIEAAGNGGMIITIMANTYADELRFQFLDTGLIVEYDDDPTAAVATISGDFRDGDYHYLTATVDSDDLDTRIDYDVDTANATLTSLGNLSVANNVAIGERYNTSNGHQAADHWGYLEGYIDELRISEGSRSLAWQKATFYNFRKTLLVDFVYEAYSIPSAGIEVDISISGAFKTGVPQISVGAAWKEITDFDISISEVWKSLA